MKSDFFKTAEFDNISLAAKLRNLERDYTKFSELEKIFKSIYYSEHSELISKPLYFDKLNDLIQQYSFLPPIYDFYKESSNEESFGNYRIKEPKDLGFIHIARHERYCYPLIHAHEYVEAIYVLRGDCRHYICGQYYDMHQGDFMILSPEAPHCLLSYNDQDVIINILMSRDLFDMTFMDVFDEQNILAQFFSEILYTSNASPFILFPTGNDSMVRKLIDQMWNETCDKRRYYSKYLILYLKNIFLHLLRNFDMEAVVPSPMDSKIDKHIVAILNYIFINYNHVKIKKLADFFNYSENYLSTIIKAYTGKTFSTIVTELQMKEAKDLLENTNIGIHEISEKVGCFDLSHFIKKFKSFYDTTPAKYRKNHKENQVTEELPE